MYLSSTNHYILLYHKHAQTQNKNLADDTPLTYTVIVLKIFNVIFLYIKLKNVFKYGIWGWLEVKYQETDCWYQICVSDIDQKFFV